MSTTISYNGEIEITAECDVCGAEVDIEVKSNRNGDFLKVSLCTNCIGKKDDENKEKESTIIAMQEQITLLQDEIDALKINEMFNTLKTNEHGNF
jgi:hypothetical protein